MKDAILGIDIGTSSTKAILFGIDGKEITSASQSYPLLTPQPGWVEQDTEEVWVVLCQVLQTIMAQSKNCNILSLSIAAQAGSIIPTDLNGDPVYPMITWLDNRSQELTNQWKKDGTAAKIRKLSGWQPFFGLPLPSIGWLKNELPEIHEKSKRFLGPADFFIHRLTGNFATDLSASSEILMVDIKTGKWSEELCAIGGADPTLQSEIGWAGRKVGEITAEAASLTGLPAGTPVIAGGNDQPCAGLGMGMTTPGKVMLSTGTAWVIMSVVDADTTDAVPEWVNLYFHAVPGKRLGGQLVGGFGATIDWWVRQSFASGKLQDQEKLSDLYDELNKAVESSPPGSKGALFLSLSGPSQLVNALPGGGFSGLDLVHTRADMSRAVLEGCAFEVRWALDELRTSGIPVEELWLAGGANRSPVWPQILADITGIPLTIAGDTDWAALGAAALAGWGVGAFTTLEEAIARLQPDVQKIFPNDDLAILYSDRLLEYKNLSRSINAGKQQTKS